MHYVILQLLHYTPLSHFNIYCGSEMICYMWEVENVKLELLMHGGKSKLFYILYRKPSRRRTLIFQILKPTFLEQTVKSNHLQRSNAFTCEKSVNKHCQQVWADPTIVPAMMKLYGGQHVLTNCVQATNGSIVNNECPHARDKLILAVVNERKDQENSAFNFNNVFKCFYHSIGNE